MKTFAASRPRPLLPRRPCGAQTPGLPSRTRSGQPETAGRNLVAAAEVMPRIRRVQAHAGAMSFGDVIVLDPWQRFPVRQGQRGHGAEAGRFGQGGDQGGPGGPPAGDVRVLPVVARQGRRLEARRPGTVLRRQAGHPRAGDVRHRRRLGRPLQPAGHLPPAQRPPAADREEEPGVGAAIRTVGWRGSAALVAARTPPTCWIPRLRGRRRVRAGRSRRRGTIAHPRRDLQLKLARRRPRHRGARSDSLHGAISSPGEMDDTGVDRIARALRQLRVLPGSIHRRENTSVRRSSPLADRRSWKLLLPHEPDPPPEAHRHRGRAAGARAAHQGYAVHLETHYKVSDATARTSAHDPGRRRGFDGPVVIAATSTVSVGLVLVRGLSLAHGRGWTDDLSVLRDHIFVRGCRRRRGQCRVVRQVHGASDHRPVWAVVVPDGGSGGWWRCPGSVDQRSKPAEPLTESRPWQRTARHDSGGMGGAAGAAPGGANRRRAGLPSSCCCSREPGSSGGKGGRRFPTSTPR